VKKTNLLLMIAVLLLAFTLAACGSPEQADFPQISAEPEVGDEPAAPEGTGDRVAREISQELQLAMGTFILEETDYPIDAEQAAALLPLWKAARSLSQSETAATQEIEAVMRQIEDAMTAEQLDAIQAMGLTFEDMSVLFEELGVETGFAGRFRDMTPEMRATMEASGEASGGGFGGGGGIPGAGGGGGSGELSPEARQTAIAERGGSRGATLGLNPALLDAIIEFLENKAQ